MDDRLKALLERERICEVLARYCIRLDEGDIDGVAQCFATDATADYGPGRGGPLTGRTAIAERIRRGQSVFRRTHHQLGQIRIDLDARGANALSYMTTWHERFTGEQEVVCLRYLDTLVQRDAVWQITSRRVEVSLVDGFPGTEWRWVRRPDVQAS